MANSVNKTSGKPSANTKARNLSIKTARTSKVNASSIKKMKAGSNIQKMRSPKVHQANKKSSPKKRMAKTATRKMAAKTAGPKKMMTKTAPLSKLMGATH